MQVDRCDELASSSIDLFVLLGVITIMGACTFLEFLLSSMVPLLSKLCKAQKKRGERLELCRTHEKMGGPRGRGKGGGLLK